MAKVAFVNPSVSDALYEAVCRRVESIEGEPMGLSLQPDPLMGGFFLILHKDEAIGSVEALPFLPVSPPPPEAGYGRGYHPDLSKSVSVGLYGHRRKLSLLGTKEEVVAFRRRLVEELQKDL